MKPRRHWNTLAGVTDALKQQDFSEGGDQRVITPLAAGLQRLVVLGLGEADGIDGESLCSGALGRQGSDWLRGHLGIQLPWSGTDPAEAACISAEAVRLCLYKDQRFRKRNHADPDALELIGLDLLQ